MWVQFLGEIDFRKVSYSHNTRIWIWIVAVNHPKISTFNKAFEFSKISSYYSYNIHIIMFLLVSHYPHFLITSCIHLFENYVQSIVLYGLQALVVLGYGSQDSRTKRMSNWLANTSRATVLDCHIYCLATTEQNTFNRLKIWIIPLCGPQSW